MNHIKPASQASYQAIKARLEAQGYRDNGVRHLDGVSLYHPEDGDSVFLEYYMVNGMTWEEHETELRSEMRADLAADLNPFAKVGQ